MIVRNFKEMADIYKSGALPFRIVQEIAFVLLGLCDYTKDIPESVKVTQQEVDWILNLPEELDFMHYMGGNVHVCENVEDLQQVTGMDIEFGKLHRRWPNCTEAVLALDDARYLINEDGTADYALLFVANNNAGGPSWFIPKHFWPLAQIDMQIKANRQFWSVAK